MSMDYPAGFGSGEPAMNAFYEHHKDSIASAIGVLTEFCSTALSSRSSSPREWRVFSVPIGTSIR